MRFRYKFMHCVPLLRLQFSGAVVLCMLEKLSILTIISLYGIVVSTHAAKKPSGSNVIDGNAGGVSFCSYTTCNVSIPHINLLMLFLQGFVEPFCW